MKSTPTTTPTPKFKRAITSSVMVASAVFMALSAPMSAYADRFDDQIRAIQSEVGAYQAQAAQLSAQADTLQNAVNQLSAQKNAIQAQITLNQTKYDKLVADIAANEAKLAKQKEFLSSTLTQLYVNNSKSPIEVLASSDSIGDYIDQQEYRATVRDQVLTAIKKVKELKEELSKQKTETEQILADQKAQRDTLAAKEAEQAQLLAETQGQESAYQNLISNKNSQISSLRSQQAAANAAAAQRYSASNLTSGGAGCGGYPAVWCNASKDTIVDNWGMYNRECVSYTAWKVEQSGRYMPYWGGRGNANQWPSSAAASGIATGSEPKVGSVAIMYVGPYGHSMYVERINGNGTIHVSQMNWRLQGEYSEMDISPSGLTFIYF